MSDQVNIDKIKKRILPVIADSQIEFVDIELKGKKGSQVLRVFIDTEHGIKLDQCEEISRAISEVLDTKDLITGKYRLEVSSPGIDRPLKTYFDFKKNVNRKVKLDYIDKNKENQTINGIIEEVIQESVFIQTEKQSVEISLQDIISAKLIPIW